MKRGRTVFLALAAVAFVGFFLWLGNFLPEFGPGGADKQPAPLKAGATATPSPPPPPAESTESKQVALPKELVDAKKKTDEVAAEVAQKPTDYATLKKYRETLMAESKAYRETESKLFAARNDDDAPLPPPGQTAPTVLVHDPALFGFLPLKWLIFATLIASTLILIAQLLQFSYARSYTEEVIQKTSEWLSDLKAKISDIPPPQPAGSAPNAGAKGGFSEDFINEVSTRLETLTEQIRKVSERGLGEGGRGTTGSGPDGDNEQALSKGVTEAADDTADGGPFPAMAQDLLNRMQGRGTVVKPDMRGILIPDSEGHLIVVERASKPGGFYVIPKETYFHPDVFAFGYKEYFSNNRDVPGNVNVIRPASAVRAGKGWQVISPGELETT